MAQIFKINGTTLSHITNGDWDETPETGYFNGKTPKNRWRPHRLSTDGMPASEYNTLFALLGQKVSLTTTNYADRNGDYRTYYGVDFQSIRGEHDGPIFRGVVAEFLVSV